MRTNRKKILKKALKDYYGVEIKTGDPVPFEVALKAMDIYAVSENKGRINNVIDSRKLGKIDDVLENTPVIDLENYDHEDVKKMNETLDAIADIIG